MPIFEIHVHQTVDIDRVISKLNQIIKTLSLMPTSAETKQLIRAAIDEILSATDNIAADIERLAGQAEGGVSPEDAAAFVSELTAVGTKLREVANKNPEPEV